MEWEQWKRFRNARNEMAHAYHEPIADDIVDLAPKFVEAAVEILHAIARRAL